MKKYLKKEALRLRAENAREEAFEWPKNLQAHLGGADRDRGHKQVLKVVEDDSEKEIGVSTARNGYTIQLKDASIGKHCRRHESGGNHATKAAPPRLRV